MVRLKFSGRTALSLALFYVGWWASALGAKHGMPWLGPALVPFAVGLHLAFSPVRKGELRFVILLAFTGLIIDSVLIKLQLFTITGGETYAPQWLVAMWVLLGLTFEGMLAMRRNFWLLVLAGGLTGPLTYIWCEGVELLSYSRPLWYSLPLHAVFWAALTPLIFKLRDICLSSVPALSAQTAWPEQLREVLEPVPVEPEWTPEPVRPTPQAAEWAEPSHPRTHSAEPGAH